MATAPPQIPGLTDWRPLARGGFATVWQARQASLNRLVAVKVDQRQLDTDVERRRFLREAGAAGRMSGHPGIVTVHDAGILADDRPFLVMELCPGGSLNRWLKDDARPTQRRVRDVGARIADALAATHSRGVLHRDVKPANILVDAFDNVGLADFGLAAMPEPGEELSVTLDGLTPTYAPPEVFDQAPPTEAGDVFSLAATLYALLAGRPARGLDDGKPSLAAALEQRTLPIEAIPGVDPGLMDLLIAAMAHEPGERPTAAQFRDQLNALGVPDVRPGEPDPSPAAEVGPPAPEPPPPDADPSVAAEELTVDGPQRRRSLVAVVVVAVLVLAVVVTVALMSTGNQTASPTSNLTSGPVPTAGQVSTAVPTPGPTPTPEELPRGYRDCSDRFGGQTSCVTVAECWGGVFTYADQPALGTAQSCTKNHVYQTFAAGQLDSPVRTQSQLEKNAQVKKVCSRRVANSMLPEEDRRDNWEVFALPPQPSKDDNLYRCIFGRGERSEPLVLQRPQ